VNDSRSGEHVVVAAALCRGDRVLLVHRSPHREWYPACWDLPGGHVEPGEQPRRALERELREELSIETVVQGPVLAQVRGSDFRMDVWAISSWHGAPANQAPEEHDALDWFNEHELGSLQLSDPRLQMVVRAAIRFFT
jgi:8-oxo-dGTP pyrophosphatase MutT (NUDIX family)